MNDAIFFLIILLHVLAELPWWGWCAIVSVIAATIWAKCRFLADL